MKLRKFVLFALVLVVLSSCSMFSSSDPLDSGEMMFWKVSDEDSSVYLLGSMHFGKKEFFPMDKVVEDAFTQSDLLAVEVDMLNVDQMMIQQMIASKGIYMDGTTIKDHISPETYELLVEYFTALNAPMQQINMMKPGLINISIVQNESMKAGLNAEYGIDVHFLNRANEMNKEIVELEGIEGQIELLFSSDESSSEGLLRKSLVEAENYKEQLNSLADIWQRGDAQAMKAYFTNFETKEEEAYIKSLFGDRDTKMTAKIEDMLAQNKTAFVIVGAGHYVNDTGIIRRLLDSGKYEVVKY